MHREMAVLLTV